MSDFGELLVRAQRDNGKVLVRDAVRDVNVRLERGEEHKRRHAVALSLEHEHKIDRGWGLGGSRSR